MPGTLQPLDQKFAIVDRNGNPTEYFTRWAQQKQIDIGDSITLADLQTYLTAHKLIQGTGIQLTPDGDINDGVTIHADVQAILDEITATRGAVLYRGLLGWAALLPGTAGLFLQTSGAGADPVWAAAGGGGGGVGYNGFLTATPPDPANFTLVGTNPAGTTTAFVAAQSFNITLPAGATSAKYVHAIPASPWNVFAAVALSADGTTGNDLSICLFDASNNFVRKHRLTMVGDWRYGVSSGGGDLSVNTTQQGWGGSVTFFMKMSNDGTNIKYWYSMDFGLTWWLFFSEAVSGISTATQWGFVVQNSSGSKTMGATFWALYTA